MPSPTSSRTAKGRMTRRRNNRLLRLQVQVREGAGKRLDAVEGDLFPRRGLGKQLANQQVVERVARLVAVERADQGLAEEIQVAHRIERLVLHELVVHAQ